LKHKGLTATRQSRHPLCHFCAPEVFWCSQHSQRFWSVSSGFCSFGAAAPASAQTRRRG